MSLDLLTDLNPAQREAVLHGNGPLLLLAGAGSGKTRTITRRVAHLILNRGLHPQQLLAITFTNKAAKEMKERVLRWVPVPGLWICTFHSMCVRILRREIEPLGFGKEFSIYDTSDRDLLLKEILKEQNVDTQHYRPSQIGNIISGLKNRMVSAEKADEGGGYAEKLVARAYRRYQERMKDLNALDFDDLLLYTLEIFDKFSTVRDRYAEQFQYLMIDEFQDTNRVQYLLAKHLANQHRNLCCCGDPDQSIYKWRGADLNNILDFEKDFPDAIQVKLEQNYRSTKNVLGAAEAVIRNNRLRKPKTLWTENRPGELLTLLPCMDEEEEANEIAAQIRSLKASNRNYGDIAVFYRVNFLQRALEKALRQAAIPYQVVAGVEFFQRREIKDLVAFLQCLANPKDDLALLRIINAPPRGIGDSSKSLLESWARARGLSLVEALLSGDTPAEMASRASQSIKKFSQLLKSWMTLVDGAAAQALVRILEDTGYASYVGSLGGPEDLDRAENLEELVAYARDFDHRDPEGGVRGFLQEISLVANVDSMEDDQDRVTLMTLHSAKGLEFPVVFIAGVEEGLLPHSRSKDEEEELEEERRLFYVGMTRAKEKLLLTYARTRLHYGAGMTQQPSRFLSEIPEALVEKPPAPEKEWEFVPQEDVWQELPFQSGDLVRHEHFGVGKVSSIQGSGANARILVDFTRHGRKMLLLSYAKLTRAEPMTGL